MAILRRGTRLKSGVVWKKDTT
ncbi:hypothetical protein CCACVL1_17481, partial [Corchorus capsularis]